jgi:hypothetical protein
VSEDEDKGGLALMIGPDDGHEAKVALVRKLMLALKKDDEHAATDALESFFDECDSPSDDGADEGEA